MRVLGRLRLSRSTDESTSIERQREIIEQWSNAQGHTVVGWAEDIDVSGAVDPFDTPQLGEWLNDRAPEWDILCAWKLDRLGRNAIQLNKLFAWCGEHDKTVVSCSESIDLGSWAGRMLASVIAGLAEGELEAIRERQTGSRRKLRESARWPGGKPPYGYLGIPPGTVDPRCSRGHVASCLCHDGPGWTLKIDPEASKVVRRIVDELIDGKPLTRIGRELTSEGYRSPAAYYTTVKAGQPSLRWADGETPTGKWGSTPLRNMLRSKALRGYVHHAGETIRDDDGMPIQLAEPLVTLDEWELIQAALDRVQQSRRGILKGEPSPLAGLVVCYECGQTLHHDRTTVHRSENRYVYRYYRCPNKDSAMIPADDVAQLAEDAFLEKLGDQEVRERVWVPGDSREAEMREALTALDELTQAAGRAKSATMKQRLQRQLDALDTKIVELESAPKREARWEYRPTGGTYGSVWKASDTDQRRELLRRSGITIAISRIPKTNAYKFEIRIPPELRMH